MPGPVNGWVTGRWQMDKPSQFVTCHQGQLSLAIPPWVDTVNTSKNWDVNRHTLYLWSSSVNWCPAKG